MNITHLRYAIEVANVGSISGAAENLFMSQPNLSKAIKELEGSIGFMIFDRNKKGITVTDRGEQFLKYARNLINQMDTIENLFNPANADLQRLAVSAPRIFYPAFTLTKLIGTRNSEKTLTVDFIETNSSDIVKNIISGESKLGIYRYPKSQSTFVNDYLADKDIVCKPFFTFTHHVMLSESNPLAAKRTISYKDLEGYTEIVYRDDSNFYTKRNLPKIGDDSRKIMYISQRATFIDLLNSGLNCFCWNSPIPQQVAAQYKIAQRECSDSNVEYCDAFIYDKNFRFSETYTLYSDMVKAVTKELEAY